MLRSSKKDLSPGLLMSDLEMHTQNSKIKALTIPRALSAKDLRQAYANVLNLADGYMFFDKYYVSMFRGENIPTLLLFNALLEQIFPDPEERTFKIATSDKERKELDSYYSHYGISLELIKMASEEKRTEEDILPAGSTCEQLLKAIGEIIHV